MIVTRRSVSEKLLAYLNRRISLAQLVDWAEGTFVDATLSPDEDIDLLNDILAYLAAADTAQFPLTWDVCTEFMDRLGVPIQVIATKRSA
jgi:hypothetical protein